jgi:tetratricopeptide (TPR) repeat protein
VSAYSQPKLVDQDRLDGWKDIAAYLGRNERTVRRWEAREGLPVHRHAHDKRSSVYAYRVELERWRSSRAPENDEGREPPVGETPLRNRPLQQPIPSKATSKLGLTAAFIAVLMIGGLGTWLLGRPWRRAGPVDQTRAGDLIHRTSPEAMVAYQTGLYEFNRGALSSALSFAREAVHLDPALAPAHELLGMTLEQEADFGLEAYSSILPEARAALRRALELDPKRGKSLTWLGETYFFGEHDWARAEANMKHGFALDPSTGNNYGALLAAEGRFDEAISAGNAALRSDPANPILIADVARLYQFARLYDQSIPLFRKAAQIGPSNAYAPQWLTINLFLAGQKDDAFEAWLSTLSVQGHQDLEKGFRKTYRMGGWPAVWASYIEMAPSIPKPTSQVYKLWALVFLDRKKDAMDLLERLEQNGSPLMVRLEDPMFDPVRGEPRFKALLKRVGYPASMLR